MKKNNKEIRRGDIYKCNLQPTKGHEKDGINRPVLIVQNDIGNKYSPTTIGVTLTSQFSKKEKSYPINVYVKKDSINGLEKDSLIDSGQIRILDVKKRINDKMGNLSRTDMIKVDTALKISLDLMEKCPNCDFMILELREKCPKCNLKLYNKCECDKLLNVTWKFCPYCGKEFIK